MEEQINTELTESDINDIINNVLNNTEPEDPTESLEIEDPQEEVIPENNDSITITDYNSRFSGALWYDKVREQFVTLAGIGGIGSNTAYLLSRLNIAYLSVYDDDVVDASNMSGQFFTISDIGRHKVHSLYTALVYYSNYRNIATYSRKFTPASTAENIMICGFDNMEARKIFFNAWKRKVSNTSEKQLCLFIDGRLSVECMQIFCINGTDSYNMQKYEREYLFDDSEAEATICSNKQTSFMATMISSYIVNLFVNHCANLCSEDPVRELPFFTEYSAETMYLKTIL